MKAIIALSIVALLLVGSVSAYVSVTNPYTGQGYGNTYGSQYSRTYNSRTYSRTYDTSYSAPRYTTSYSAPRYTYSYQRGYANYGIRDQWRSPYTNAWRDRVRRYQGFNRDPSISYRFGNQRYQNRYNSYCASHPGLWAC